jgi:hypothetical protein
MKHPQAASTSSRASSLIEQAFSAASQDWDIGVCSYDDEIGESGTSANGNSRVQDSAKVGEHFAVIVPDRKLDVAFTMFGL